MKRINWPRALSIFTALSFAFVILFISVLRSAEVRYQFNRALVPDSSGVNRLSQIEYYFPYPGKVLPGNPFWEIKTLRDRVWYLITTDSGKKADILLLFADKRINTALVLFESGEPELGVATLQKAEQYLVEASEKEKQNRQNGADTSEFLKRLSLASLKHYETIQFILGYAPEDARPIIESIETYTKSVYESTRDSLNELQISPPLNPFVW